VASEERASSDLPEVDRAGWFDLPAARAKIIESQRLFHDRLMDRGANLRS
jgi:predicted NUDIX family NTP pyrophosphohydrolase